MKLLTTIAMLFTSALVALAQPAITTTPTTTTTTSGTTTAPVPTPPKLYMLSSSGAMVAWAHQAVRRADAGIYTNVRVPSSSDVTYVSVSGVSDSDDGLKKLTEKSFTMTIADNRDSVNIYSELLDEDYYQLFYGQSPNGVSVSGSGQVLIGKSAVTFKVNPVIPIPVGNAVNQAIVYFRDKDGNFQWQENLSVYNGRVFMPLSYGDEDVRLVLQYNGKASVEAWVYDLRTNAGEPISTPVLTATSSYGIENYISYDDTKGWNGVVNMTAIAQDIYSTPPAVRLNVTTRRVVTLNCNVLDKNGNLVEKPTSGKIIPKGETLPTAWKKGLNGDLILEPGVYYIWWNTQSFDTQPTSPWDQGNGKG